MNIIHMSDPGKSNGGSHVITYKRVRNGDFYADFRRDKRLHPEIYHCLIQRDGSSQILSWKQYRSLEHAIEAAEAELKRLTETPSPQQFPRRA